MLQLDCILRLRISLCQYRRTSDAELYNKSDVNEKINTGKGQNIAPLLFCAYIVKPVIK